jgi:hypothetical protein
MKHALHARWKSVASGAHSHCDKALIQDPVERAFSAWKMYEGRRPKCTDPYFPDHICIEPTFQEMIQNHLHDIYAPQECFFNSSVCYRSHGI